MRRVRRAFSLIELLVVLTIIAILMALSLPSLSKARDGAEFLNWSAYSRGIQMDPDLVAYWTFENQGDADTFIVNQAGSGGISLAPYETDELTVATALNREEHEFSFAPPSSAPYFDITPVVKTTWAANDFTLRLMDAGEIIDPGGWGPPFRATAQPFWTQGRWNKKSAIAFGRLPDSSPARNGLRAPHHHDLGLSGTPFTFWVWARSEDGRYGAIASKYDSLTRTGYRIEYRYFDPLGDAAFIYIHFNGTGTSLPALVRNGSIKRNEWALFVFTYDGAVLRSYANGKLGYTRPIVLGDFSNDRDLLVGISSWPTRPFRGDIDELGILRRAMTPEEIENLYNAGITTTYGGPIHP